MNKSPPEAVVAHTRKLAPDPKTNHRRLGFSRRHRSLRLEERGHPLFFLVIRPTAEGNARPTAASIWCYSRYLLLSRVWP
jgi:hypothetical protein